MATRTGKVILAKDIALDKGHTNVLDYSESDMVNLLTTNAVYTTSNCSFIRQGSNQVDINVTYSNALKCNYMAFQNPDYDNKWFFAFIDEVEYKSEGMTRVTFTIDDFATWFDYWTPKACYVIREHTNDDTFGSNLIPENLELGEYVNNGEVTNFNIGGGGAQTLNGYICVSNIYSPDNVETKSTCINGIPSSGGLFLFDSMTSLANNITKWSNTGHLESINIVYLLPENAFDSNNLTAFHQSDSANVYWQYNGSNGPRVLTRTFTTPTRLNGYKPKNNKLWTAPYQFLMVSNNNGSSINYQYEYFTDPATITLECDITCSVGGSMIVYPKNYKNLSNNYNESIMGGKWPTLSWSGDAYTNWLTQNSVNIGLGLVNNVVGLMDPKTVGGAINGIANQVAQIYQHSITPETTRGNINGGDVLTSYGVNQFYCYYMSIRADMAERIDDYFSRYGYKTNKTKIPNQTGRIYWNYVQIANSEDIGYSNQSISVPAPAMENINNIYRAGTTIWHDHANVGNYSLENEIEE